MELSRWYSKLNNSSPLLLLGQYWFQLTQQQGYLTSSKVVVMKIDLSAATKFESDYYFAIHQLFSVLCYSQSKQERVQSCIKVTCEPHSNHYTYHPSVLTQLVKKFLFEALQAFALD